MSCWSYGELSKESFRRGRLRVQLCCWVTVGEELGVSIPQSRTGREINFKQKRCHIPRNFSADSTVYQMSCLEHRESSKHQAFSARVPQGIAALPSPKAVGWAHGVAEELPDGDRAASTCGTKWAVHSGLVYSQFVTQRAPHSAACAGKWFQQLHFSSPRVQQSWKRRGREKRAGVKRAKENLFIWRTSLTFQNWCGEWIFLLQHIAPSFIKLYLSMWVHLLMCFTPSGMGQCHCHHACPVCAGCREGNTVLLSRAACHIHPSSPAFPCLPLCYGECTAITSSDFWLFPGFCFFFHILFIFPTCIRCLQVFLLWAMKRALGLKRLMVVTSWVFYARVCLSNFVYESGIDKPGREGWDMWTKLHRYHGWFWFPSRNSPGGCL